MFLTARIHTRRIVCLMFAVAMLVLFIRCSPSASGTKAQQAQAPGGSAEEDRIIIGVGITWNVKRPDIERILKVLPPDATDKQKVDATIYKDLPPNASEAEKAEALARFLNPTITDEQPAVVEKVFPSSPAQTAGVLPGDIIVKVDGNSVIGRPAQDLLAALRGDEGTHVKLTVLRHLGCPGGVTEIDFDLVRARMTVRGKFRN